MKRLFMIAAFAALSLIVADCSRSPANKGSPPLPVNVVTVVEKEVNEWEEFTGRLDPVESVEIRPRVSGYITEIHFEAGAIVKKGDLLYVIDPRPYQADFDRAAAEVDRMDAQLKLAQIELNRAKELRDKNTISASEFDQKAATYQGSAAAKRSAEAAKNAILKYVKLSEEGKRVSARTENIPAWVELGNESNFPHQGYIDFVDNRLDPSTGTVRARVVLKNWNPNLITPGFFVRTRVAGATPYRAALIEDKVISSQQGLKYAFVVKPDNTVERRN